MGERISYLDAQIFNANTSKKSWQELMVTNEKQISDNKSEITSLKSTLSSSEALIKHLEVELSST